MYLILQLWGGVFYLANKIFFALAARADTMVLRRKRLIYAWVVYLWALPAWVVVFLMNDNWIAAAVEAGAGPSMLVGLIIAVKGHGEAPEWLSHVAKATTVIGIGLSLYQFGGITSIRQVFELGIATGFLFGTYYLAHQKPSGYLWFILGNLSCALLMGVQGIYIMMGQQILSLIFVFDAYRQSTRRSGEQRA